MSDTAGFVGKCYERYAIVPYLDSFDLDVSYWNYYFDEEDTVTIDALEVYNNLKEYFKGTEHE